MQQEEEEEEEEEEQSASCWNVKIRRGRRTKKKPCDCLPPFSWRKVLLRLCSLEYDEQSRQLVVKFPPA